MNSVYRQCLMRISESDELFYTHMCTHTCITAVAWGTRHSQHV